MPDLDFQVSGAAITPFAAVPSLTFRLQIADAAGQAPIHSVMLRCQIQIAATRRRYSPAEQAGLRDLFGEPERWSQTMRSLLWTHATLVVPAFSGETAVELPIPCSYDFHVAATKYFHASEAGEIPLLFLFSGTIFYAADSGALQVAQIAWSKEAAFLLPAALWQQLMAQHYPNAHWLPVPNALFERLYRYKLACGLPGWEQALDSLLSAGERQL